MVSSTSLFIIAVNCIHLTYCIMSLKDLLQFQRVFGDPHVKSNKIQIMHVPEECRGKNFCTVMPKYYPQERFNKLFENKTVFPQPTMHAVDPNLINRWDDYEDDACDTEVEYNPITMVRDPNTDDETWRLVVQAPEHDYVQAIYTVTCKNVHKKCDPYGFFYNYVSYCKQKHASVTLLVAKGESDTEVITVKLPICCTCVIKKMEI